MGSLVLIIIKFIAIMLLFYVTNKLIISVFCEFHKMRFFIAQERAQYRAEAHEWLACGTLPSMINVAKMLEHVKQC